PDEIRARIVALAAECGLDPAGLDRIAGEASAAVRARVHLARAIAPDPALLLMEHPTAWIPAADRAGFAHDVARVCDARSLTAVAVTTDREFAAGFAHRTLTLQGATGTLVTDPQKRWW